MCTIHPPKVIRQSLMTLAIAVVMFITTNETHAIAKAVSIDDLVSDGCTWISDRRIACRPGAQLLLNASVDMDALNNMSVPGIFFWLMPPQKKAQCRGEDPITGQFICPKDVVENLYGVDKTRCPVERLNRIARSMCRGSSLWPWLYCPANLNLC